MMLNRQRNNSEGDRGFSLMITDRNHLYWRRRFKSSLICLLHFIIAASLFLVGCAGGDRIRGGGADAVDLTDRLLPLNSVPSSDVHVKRRLRVTRKGQGKDALVLIAPSSMVASLQGISGAMVLEGSAAPVFNVGDGIQMNLFLKRAGTRHAVGSRYFDPGRKAEDRDWIPIAVPLDLIVKDQLEIEISGGPQGDLVADWLALSSWHLVQRSNKP
jgi:hypothetical protein